MAKAELWLDDKRVGEGEWTTLPEVGDLIELEHGGKVGPYEVTKDVHYYPIDGDPVRRLVLQYAGPRDPRAMVF